MFSGGAPNPYDESVAKATDENLTTENWEIILNLCDKVQEEGPEGARDVIAAVLKRLAHRNPNVQLYALSLAESLSKNLGVELHREIASKAFTQGLEKLITDRTTHDKVKRRALGLIAMWTADFEKDTTLGVMEDCYNSLKQKGHKFEPPEEPLPPSVDDEIRRKEEEELQRVLEMSMQDKGGRDQWSAYSAVASSGAGGSGSSSGPAQGSSATTVAPSSSSGFTAPKYQAGYVPARTPTPTATDPQVQHFQLPAPQQQQAQAPLPSTETTAAAASNDSSASAATLHAQGAVVTRVRALHTFEPTEPGELGFEKGDIIKVVDRGYKDWWRGQLKGRTGIFPVNYVEAMPEPTPAELAREAEQEAAVFGQAVNVEKLLTMLRSLDPTKDNLADNEEIQELYRSCMALRPKVVKLIDKYSQKRADLVSMNETFVRARTIFDRMMEESLARHTGVYQESYRTPQYRPGSSGQPGGSGPHTYPWGQNGYNVFPTPTPAPLAQVPYPMGQPTGLSDPSVYSGSAYDPNTASAAAYAQHQQQMQAQQAYQAHPSQQTQSQALQQPQLQVNQTLQAQQSPPAQSGSHAPGQLQALAQAVPVQSPTSPQPGAAYGQQGGYIGQQLYGVAGSLPYLGSQAPQVQAQVQPQVQTQTTPPQQNPPTQQPAQPQAQPIQPLQLQPQQVSETVATQPAQTTDVHAHATVSQPLQQVGPPYAFNPGTVYTDPNVQAWAQYYAKGGRDPQGAVYFISVPGVKPPPASPAGLQSPQETTGSPEQTHSQLQQQQQTYQTQQQLTHIQPLQAQPVITGAQQPTLTKQDSFELPYPGDAVPAGGSTDSYFATPNPHPEVHQPYGQQQSPQSPQQDHHSPLPQQQQQQQQPPFNAASSTATPSWVIPKRTASPVGSGGAASTAYYDNITKQFTGLNVGSNPNA